MRMVQRILLGIQGVRKTLPDLKASKMLSTLNVIANMMINDQLS